MKGIRLANVIAVWKWWYKLIYMLVFSQYFLLNVHHLSDSIYIWNCCNQALCFKFKNNLEALAITIFAWIFLQIPIQKHNCSSMHSDNKISELIFLFTLYFHGQIAWLPCLSQFHLVFSLFSKKILHQILLFWRVYNLFVTPKKVFKKSRF